MAKNPLLNARDVRKLGSILHLKRASGGGHGNPLQHFCLKNLESIHICICIYIYIHTTPLQYSCLESPMDGGAWWAAIHGVTKSRRTRLSDFPFTFDFHPLEKEMATHSSVLAWRIPGMGEPGGLPSMGSHRVGHD